MTVNTGIEPGGTGGFGLANSHDAELGDMEKLNRRKWFVLRLECHDMHSERIDVMNAHQAMTSRV